MYYMTPMQYADTLHRTTSDIPNNFLFAWMHSTLLK